MKGRTALIEDGSPGCAYAPEELGAAPAPGDVRIEDLGDGSARVSLRLPWRLVLEVLDLASTSAEPRPATT